jgi:hypothetical protein
MVNQTSDDGRLSSATSVLCDSLVAQASAWVKHNSNAIPHEL